MVVIAVLKGYSQFMSNTSDNRPIGVFDSGLGGLTSVRALEKLLPNENIIYFGDTGRVPYGTRSNDTIIRYSTDDLAFLVRCKVKAVLIACGTVSSIALPVLSRITDIPIVGVVSPACENACRDAANGKCGTYGNIAVLGTQATAKNGAYEARIHEIDSSFNVKTVPCPMFVPLAENGYIDDGNKVTMEIAREYIGSLSEFRPSSIILGCTHYPILRSNIERACREVLGYLPSITDAGECAARAVGKMLAEKEALSEKREEDYPKFFVSDEIQNFTKIASAFLGRNIGNVSQIKITDQKPYEVLDLASLGCTEK